MISQGGDCAKTKFLCSTSRHHQRVSAVEPERFGHADAGLAELVRDLLESQLIAAFQNFLRDGAGIFGINADLSGAQRFPKNDGATHSLAVLTRNSGIAQSAFRYFAEHVRFSKFLRSNLDRAGSR